MNITKEQSEKLINYEIAPGALKKLDEYYFFKLKYQHKPDNIWMNEFISLYRNRDMPTKKRHIMMAYVWQLMYVNGMLPGDDNTLNNEIFDRKE